MTPIALLILVLASPPWFGVNSLNPSEPAICDVMMQELQPQWCRVKFVSDMAENDRMILAQRGLPIIGYTDELPINLVTMTKVLDRYGQQIKIIEACNEPVDYDTLTNSLASWQRILAGRSYRPALAAPSNQNSTDTYGIYRRLINNGYSMSINYICFHEYSGRIGNGTMQTTNTTYTHPDQSPKPWLPAFERYRQLASLGKPLICTEFAFEPTDLRDAAIWATVFNAVPMTAVLFHWPQQQAGESLGGQYDWTNQAWSPAMMTFTNAANIRK